MSEKAIVAADANGDDSGSVATIAGGASGGVGASAIGFSILYSAGIPGFSASGITSGLAAMGMGSGMLGGIAVFSMLPLLGVAAGSWVVYALRHRRR